ncbi:hypothetical protein VN1192_02170 [Helicobacter pylori]|nr:hypothetical protein VN1192_02170 [Helicobacter pylori]
MDKRDTPTKPPQTFKIQIRYNHQLQSFNKREFYEKYFQSVCLFNRIFFKRSVGAGFKNRCCFKEEVYAKGVLVLWSENLKIDSLEILKDPKIKRIAMANP